MRKGILRSITLVLAVLLVASVGGALATWYYANEPAHSDHAASLHLGEFLYAPVDMPTEEVSVIQRLSDVLNQKFKSEIVTDSRDYLINKTIQVYWGGDLTADPYVGSMDADFTTQIEALFGDVLHDTSVSFLLKNEDLNGDGFNEIAMYSTSDVLDCVQEFEGIVCVYVTVFTPVVDEQKNIVGYSLVCESLRGYCYEVFYSPAQPVPSFSTNEWHNDVGYYHYDGWVCPVPDDALSYDGTKLYKYDHASYGQYFVLDGWWTGKTHPCGQTLAQCLWDKIPDLR